MSRTTPRSFLQSFVEPNYFDYIEAADDVRLGFNASLPAFQLADVFYAFYRQHDPDVIRSWKTLKDLHMHLGYIEPCYTTVQSVATVYKHLYAGRGGHYEVSSPARSSLQKLLAESWRSNLPGSADRLTFMCFARTAPSCR